MGVEGIGSALSGQVSSSQSSGLGGSDLTISDFFQLIAAQLQNQSMYDTVDNAEFMSQMVQFRRSRRWEELSTAFQSNLAVSMIGKTVNVSTTDDHDNPVSVRGMVSQISYSNGTPS
jgi:flagellar basal-body rod modification protein FlgD